MKLSLLYEASPGRIQKTLTLFHRGATPGERESARQAYIRMTGQEPPASQGPGRTGPIAAPQTREQRKAAFRQRAGVDRPRQTREQHRAAFRQRAASYGDDTPRH